LNCIMAASAWSESVAMCFESSFPARFKRVFNNRLCDSISQGGHG
jgi:hypothetical protein